MTNNINLENWIRSISDFPKPGIVFRDITPLLADPVAFGNVISRFADYFRDAKIDAVLAAEARGFIFATPLALELNASFVPIRKPGKLPFDTHSFHYELEYGTDTLEMHTDAIQEGDRVLLVDDLLATGGTIGTCIKMAEEANATVVGCAFLIELDFLNGREHLHDVDICSLIHYESE
ncbi:Adenine phosphoribosyltransferase [hydrothermal vent metagenome]|uniref:adenine phosphoribosyltransferase n=1 Tax=hydrothermal vent metagenome TaxID=652676 RepID=A0A3B1E0E6_9ZZZZ